jgi:hypothetical protein
MNLAYVHARDALIPAAEEYANKKVGDSSKGREYQEWADDWNFHFHTKMADLAHEAGLCGPQIRRWENK